MSTVRIIPLGGLGEVGRNSLVLEVDGELVLVDAGLMFPEEEMLGIDLVIPDFTYVRERVRQFRGILITHAHEDHIGALPFLLRDHPVPVYGTKLTLGLLRTKLKEHKLHESTDFREISVGVPFRIGGVELEAYHVCHSIPDAVGFVARTRLGQIVHSGDWKFDHTPVDGQQTDFAHLARIAERGVHLLLSDSTRAEVPGYTRSEAYVGDLLESIFSRAAGRIIITTFASNISRIKQIVEIAAAWGRRTSIIGRSMENYSKTARELGYLDLPEHALLHPSKIGDVEDAKLCIITTGSQGEPTSALARMAVGDHKFVAVKPGDTVVLSATPIPGNEELVNRTIDNLYKLGAEVIYDAAVRPHVSGHASQEELKLMLNILRPTHFVPLHGEYRMLVRHARLAEDLGVAHENVHVLENGDVLELDENGARLAGSVSAGYVYVDGLGVGDVTQVVVRDRWALASDGIFVVVVGVDHETGRLVSGPDIITKGFVPPEDEGEIVEASRQRVLEALDGGGPETRAEVSVIKARIHESVGPLLYERTKRRPMLLPIVTEV
ncbi:MAG: ribonuclease J [Chloroflexi bacterium 13_1_40CM_4_68_4]|nr:MAG: ribonuclease J [Chloroflexi bacterium 13_1_40CM_4_68_4]